MVDCNFNTAACASNFDEAPLQYNNNVYNGAYISPRADASSLGISGGDIFDFKFRGTMATSGLYQTPIFLWTFNPPKGVAYFWNADFGNNFTYATALAWNNGSNHSGWIFEGVTVDITVQDSTASPVQSATLGLVDKNGNAAWCTGKTGANHDPQKAYAIQTDTNGSYTGPFGSNEGAFVVRAKWAYASQFLSIETPYHPFTFRVRKYGKKFTETSKNWSERTKEFITLEDNAFITQANEATVAAYTGIAVDYAAKAVTVSASHTINDLYDYLQYHNALTTSIQYSEVFTTSDGVNYTFATDWNLTVTGAGVALTSSTQAIAFTGTGALTVAAGALFEDKSRAVWESGGSMFYASHVQETFKDGATPVQGVEAAFFDSGSVNRLYTLGRVNQVITSDANGLVEGYVVYQIDTTAYTSQTLTARQYGYTTVSVPKAIGAAPITEDVLL